jgi:hypothetical protein
MRTILVLAGLLLATTAVGMTAAAAPCVAPNNPLPATGLPGQAYNACLQNTVQTSCSSTTDVAAASAQQWPVGASARVQDSQQDCFTNYGWYSYRDARNSTSVSASVTGVASASVTQGDRQYSDAHGYSFQETYTNAQVQSNFVSASMYQSDRIVNGQTQQVTHVQGQSYLLGYSGLWVNQNAQGNGNCSTYVNTFGSGPCYVVVPMVPRVLSV